MHDHIMYYTSLNLCNIYIIYNVSVYNNIDIYTYAYYKYKTQEPNM